MENLQSLRLASSSDYNERRTPMTLLTAHKILIGTSAVFFVFLSGWEFNNYFSGDGVWTLARGTVYLGIGIGFAIYFRSLRKRVL
jgi:hypothetical protein